MKLVVAGLLLFFLLFSGCWDSELYDTVEEHGQRIGLLEEEVFYTPSYEVEVDSYYSASVGSLQPYFVDVYWNYSLFNGYSRELEWRQNKEWKHGATGESVWNFYRENCTGLPPLTLNPNEKFEGQLVCSFDCREIEWFADYKRVSLPLGEQLEMPYYLKGTEQNALTERNGDEFFDRIEFNLGFSDRRDKRIYETCQAVINYWQQDGA